jgi:hypothetical protein
MIRVMSSNPAGDNFKNIDYAKDSYFTYMKVCGSNLARLNLNT